MTSLGAAVAVSSAVLLALGALVAGVPWSVAVPLVALMGALALAADLAARLADRLDGRPPITGPHPAGRHRTTRHRR